MKKFTDAPIPYFGNKKYIAGVVWELLGDVRYYIEPFAGILGCLLYRPKEHEKFCETVNDLNGYLVNMWRAIQLKPLETAHYSADMVSEMDYHAKWYYLRHYDTTEFCQRLEREPEFCDPRLAGWYIEVMCAAIGSAGNGVNAALPHIGNAGSGVNAELPHVSDVGRGVNAELPHIGNVGRGVNAGLPHIGNSGQDMTHKEAAIREWFSQLSERLCDVRICYGDWKRVLTPSLIKKSISMGIFLDPPYKMQGKNIYGGNKPVSDDVRAWCAECYKTPEHKNIKLILCGYGDEHDSLLSLGWGKYAWKAQNGYNGKGKNRDADKRDEQMWLSPGLEAEYGVQMLINELFQWT
jgi:site-specific DNA-adenine methylase